MSRIDGFGCLAADVVSIKGVANLFLGTSEVDAVSDRLCCPPSAVADG